MICLFFTIDTKITQNRISLCFQKLLKRKVLMLFSTNWDGFLCKAYFALGSISDIPKLVGTVETPDVPFSSISVIKKHKDNDMTYKVFSRRSLDDALLDQIFRYNLIWLAISSFIRSSCFESFHLHKLFLYKLKICVPCKIAIGFF